MNQGKTLNSCETILVQVVPFPSFLVIFMSHSSKKKEVIFMSQIHHRIFKSLWPHTHQCRSPIVWCNSFADAFCWCSMHQVLLWKTWSLLKTSQVGKNYYICICSRWFLVHLPSSYMQYDKLHIFILIVKLSLFTLKLVGVCISLY